MSGNEMEKARVDISFKKFVCDGVKRESRKQIVSLGYLFCFFKLILSPLTPPHTL